MIASGIRSQKTSSITVLTFLLFFLASLNLHSQSYSGLNFDGIDDRCTINDHAAYNLGTGNFTIEAWIKANSVQSFAFPTILSNRETGNVNSGLLVFLNSGKLTLQMDGINLPAPGNNLKDNLCHHIAISRNGTTVTYYIDGSAAMQTVGYGQNIDAAHAFWIGRDDPSSANTPYKGWIHEVRFWNLARTITEIQNNRYTFLAGTETGLIGYWRLNDGAGQIINDFSTTNNDGFLGTVNTAESTDPLFFTGSCFCATASVITSTGGAVCTGQTPTLTATPGAGYTYQWKLNGNNIGGATSQTYVAVSAGTYTCVVTFNSCGLTSNSIVLLGGAPPASISSGGVTTICSNGSTTLSANTGAVLSYQWKLNGSNIAGATSSTYQATAAGSYTCLVSNNCGSNTSNAIAMTVVQAPTATATPQGPTSFCSGGSVTLAASTGAGYTYQWQVNTNNISGATSANYVAIASGTYRVVITANGCTAASGNVVVSVQAPLTPTITASGFGFCPSTTIGLETQYSGSYTYQWFEDTYSIPAVTGYQLFAGHNGNYKVEVTNGCGTYSSGFYTVTDFNQNPPWGFTSYITIGNNGSTTICSGGSVQLFDNSGTFFFSPSYQWYKDGFPIGGAFGSSYTATAAGNYVLSVTDYMVWCGQGPTVFSNFITITAGAGTLPVVSIAAGGNIVFCTGGSVTLNSTVNTNVTYQWQKNGVNISGATSANYVANSTGTYVCIVTNSCGSVTSNYIDVTAQTLTANATAPSLNICTGSPTTLSVNAQTGNSYQWKLNGNNISGATSYNYAASTGGTYTCTITNLCGTTTSNALIMTVRPKPTAVISGSQTICPGGTATLSIAFTGTGSWHGHYNNGTSGTTFNTALNPYTFNVTLSSTTTYVMYLDFNDAYCSGTFSGSATVTVSANPVATISPSGATTFCSGGSVQLNANTGTGYTHQWQKNGSNLAGATSSVYTATSSGTYTVIVTSSCGTATSSGVTVTVNSLPNATITAGGPITFCANGSVTLNAVVSANRTYQWKKNGTNISGATSSSYVATASGTYKVTVTNTVTGCTKTSSTGIVVTKNPLPTATISPAGTITFCAGQSALLTANSGAGYTYKWKKDGSYIGGATNQTYTVTTAGKYRVEITNSNGCSKTSNADTVVVPCKEGEAVVIENNLQAGIFPNPSQGEFEIVLDNNVELPVNIEISDMTGRIIEVFKMHNRQYNYNNTGISKGVYFVRVRGKNNFDRVLKAVVE